MTDSIDRIDPRERAELFESAKQFAAPLEITPRVLAHDRRNAALHEAGHCIEAWHRGIHCEAMIKPEPNRGDWDKTWTGRTRFLKPIYQWQIGDADRLHIALAGEIAVFRGGSDYDPDFTRENLLDEMTWDEAALMSHADWHLTGYEPGQVDRRFMRAVERVYDRFDRDMPTLYRVARDLIVRARP